MAIKAVDIQANYQVQDANNILLSIQIGEAQIGGSAAFLDGQEVGRGDIQNLNLGKGTDIKSKKLTIQSIVLDVNSMTNRTSVTYIFKGGVSDQSFTSKASVDDDKDPILHQAEFLFT